MSPSLSLGCTSSGVTAYVALKLTTSLDDRGGNCGCGRPETCRLSAKIFHRVNSPAKVHFCIRPNFTLQSLDFCIATERFETNRLPNPGIIEKIYIIVPLRQRYQFI